MEDYDNATFIIHVVTCIIICIDLPLTIMAIYTLSSLVRNDHVAPIYVINLLISDLIQLCCLIVWVTPIEDEMISMIFGVFYLSALVVSVGFMVCVALERYLVIAHPLWYRCRQTIKSSVVVCVLVWIVPLAFLLPVLYLVYFKVSEIIIGIFFLLPLLLIMFFLGGTLKALSASRVPSDEKRQTVGILVVLLLIYMLFLPSAIGFLAEEARRNNTFKNVCFIFVRLYPLAHLTLYVFMRKGSVDKLLASVCCCRMDSNDISSPSLYVHAGRESRREKRVKTEGEM